MASVQSSTGSIPSEAIPSSGPQEISSNDTPPEAVPKEVRVEVEKTPKTKAFSIAAELLTTEREYVKSLGLIEHVSNPT